MFIVENFFDAAKSLLENMHGIGFYDNRSKDLLDFTINFLSPDKSIVKCMKKTSN